MIACRMRSLTKCGKGYSCHRTLAVPVCIYILFSCLVSSPHLLLIFSSPSRCFIDPSILPTCQHISPQHKLRIPCLLPPVITFYHLRCASQLSSPVLHRQGPILIPRLSNLQNLHFMPWKTIHPCPVWNRFRIPVCPMFWKRCPNCSSPHL